MDKLEEIASLLTQSGRPISASGEGPDRVIECRKGVRYVRVSLKNDALVVSFFESPTTMAARKATHEKADLAAQQIAGWVPAAA